MAYRVFNMVTNEWVNEDVYMSPNGRLFLIKHSMFGRVKTPIELSLEEYIYHVDIGICDKHNNLVFEGDYVLARTTDGKEAIGVVCYADNFSAYIILCEDGVGYFTLGHEVAEFIEVIGNVFDGYEIDYDEPTLQEQQE